MFPLIPMISTIAGLGFGFAGMQEQAYAAKEMAAREQSIAQAQIQQNQVRYKSMEMDARRRELEVIRNSQRARALAVTTATSQGAAQGSGLQGAYGQISGQSNNNLSGIEQSLQSGKEIFKLDSAISSYRYGIADAQSKMAEGQGMSSLGNSLISLAPTFGKFFG